MKSPVEATIYIEWKRSRNYGRTPVAVMNVLWRDTESGDSSVEKFGPVRATGCGYDKESTVVGMLFDKAFTAFLRTFPVDRFKRLSGYEGESLFGVRVYPQESPVLHFALHGAGMSVVQYVVEQMGGELIHTVNEKHADVWTVRFGKEEVGKS